MPIPSEYKPGVVYASPDYVKKARELFRAQRTGLEVTMGVPEIKVVVCEDLPPKTVVAVLEDGTLFNCRKPWKKWDDND